MVGWRQLNDTLATAWMIGFKLFAFNLFPGLFPGLVLATPSLAKPRAQYRGMPSGGGICVTNSSRNAVRRSGRDADSPKSRV